MSQLGRFTSGTTIPGIETLTGNSGGAVAGTGLPANISILGGGGVNVVGTPGTSTLTISSSSTMAWSTVSANTPMVAGQGYFCIAPGGALVMTLPAVAALGTLIEVALDGATSFQIAQGAGQSIVLGNLTTTPGVGGSITSAQQGDTIMLVCRTPNLRWVATSSMGNLIVV